MIKLLRLIYIKNNINNNIIEVEDQDMQKLENLSQKIEI